MVSHLRKDGLLSGRLMLIFFCRALEFAHTILVARSYYEMGVSNFGTFNDFIFLPFSLKFSIIWECASLFITYRMHLTKSLASQ